MRTISVSKLKAHLSAELAKVKKGAQLVVTDHGTPIAYLAPTKKERKLEIIPATRPVSSLNMDHNIRIDFDPVEYLLEDRQRRFRGLKWSGKKTLPL